jgi:hypothetical protein
MEWRRERIDVVRGVEDGQDVDEVAVRGQDGCARILRVV